MKKIIVLLSFIIAAATVNADVYKWTDKKGNVHFGDRPPEQLDSTVVKKKQLTQVLSQHLKQILGKKTMKLQKTKSL